MEGLVICLSFASGPHNQEALKIVNYFRLAYTENTIAEDTAVVVTDSVRTRGYQQAQVSKNRIQCVTYKWLRDCYKSAKSSTLPLPFDKYTVPPFLGLTLTCTQVSREERADIEARCVKYGGKYVATMDTSVTTHLVCLTADEGSEKYKTARRFRLEIVTTKWVDDCISQNKWLNETKYQVKKPAVVEVAAVAPMDKSSKERSVPSGQKDTINATSVNVPSSSLGPANEPTTSGVSLAAQQIDINIPKEISRYMCTLSSDQLPSPFDLEEDPSAGSVFSGCVVFITGLTNDLSDYVTQCVLVGGGERSLVLSQDVNVAVLGEDADQKQSPVLSELRRHPVGVTCVGLLYVVEALFGFAPIAALLKEAARDLFPSLSIDFSAVQSTEELLDASRFVIVPPVAEPPVPPAATTAPLVSRVPTEGPTAVALPKTDDKRKKGGGRNLALDHQNRKRLAAEAAALTSPTAPTASAALAMLPPSRGGVSGSQVGASPRGRRSHNLNDESQVVTFGDTETPRY